MAKQERKSWAPWRSQRRKRSLAPGATAFFPVQEQNRTEGREGNEADKSLDRVGSFSLALFPWFPSVQKKQGSTSPVQTEPERDAVGEGVFIFLPVMFLPFVRGETAPERSNCSRCFGWQKHGRQKDESGTTLFGVTAPSQIPGILVRRFCGESERRKTSPTSRRNARRWPSS